MPRLLLIILSTGYFLLVESAAINSTTVAPVVPIPTTKNTTTASPAAVNPYRFSLNGQKQMVPSSRAKSTAASKPSSPPSATVATEKNWLLTKAWLIDNINRLRRELSELERDYSTHLKTIEQTNAEKEKQFIQDISKLRADHTVLSQQQKHIIYLIKKSVLYKPSVSENDFKHRMNVGKLLLKSSRKIADAPTHIRRHIKRDVSSVQMESFESQTRRDLKETFAELSSLHDITLAMFDDLRKLEKRIDRKLKWNHPISPLGPLNPL